MILDPHKNLLTTLLVAVIGVLLVAVPLMFLILGRVNLDRIDPVGDLSVAPLIVAQPDAGLEAFEEYNEIVRRPVFFSDRRLPVLQVADFDEEIMEVVEAPEPEEVRALKATVAGIIITPEMRMAMIRDQDANRTLVMREGMSLEGDQAAWRLERIEPRLVSFVSADGRSTGLELEVNTRGLARPAAQARTRMSESDLTEASADDPDDSAIDDEARSRAEEIRRRVAERRAELRAEAERRAQQQQDNR